MNGGSTVSVKSAPIRVGDQVQFDFGSGIETGIVKEDRGPIGVRGRRLFLIAHPVGSGHPSFVELPAEDLQVVTPRREQTER
jgi:hypothetical protein